MSSDNLVHLQAFIERLHGADAAPDVRAFLLDAKTWQQMPGAREGVPEQLFVRTDPSDPEGVELALYISPAVVGQLSRDPPTRRLHAGNLESFCIALEGVSHFVLVATRAESGRPVTALELELQAEVDKFVAAWLLLKEQGAHAESSARGLLRQLFSAYALREGLPPDEVDRYHVATRVAHKFCNELASEHVRDKTPRRIEHAVRRFVRQDLSEKLRAA